MKVVRYSIEAGPWRILTNISPIFLLFTRCCDYGNILITVRLINGTIGNDDNKNTISCKVIVLLL